MKPPNLPPSRHLSVYLAPLARARFLVEWSSQARCRWVNWRQKTSQWGFPSVVGSLGEDNALVRWELLLHTRSIPSCGLSDLDNRLVSRKGMFYFFLIASQASDQQGNGTVTECSQLPDTFSFCCVQCSLSSVGCRAEFFQNRARVLHQLLSVRWWMIYFQHCQIKKFLRACAIGVVVDWTWLHENCSWRQSPSKFEREMAILLDWCSLYKFITSSLGGHILEVLPSLTLACKCLLPQTVRSICYYGRLTVHITYSTTAINTTGIAFFLMCYAFYYTLMIIRINSANQTEE